MSVDGRMALRRALLAAVLGGAAAVGAEVVFTRELALLFGVTAPAAATVVSVYLGGMALGSVLGGRLADRAGDRAGWVYVIAELAAGAWAWLFPVFFAIAWDLLDARGGGLIETGLVTVVLVGPAAVASGATFPGLTRAVGQGPAIRWLYGANALGAALGGVGVGLYLPEWLGFSGSLGAAGLLSVMAAVVLGVSTRGEAPAEVSVASDPDPVSPRLAGTMQAVIGGVGMASEIGWTRILEQTGPNPGSLCFPIVLAAYLVGLALGTVVLAPVLARLGERRGLGMGALLAALGPLLGVLALLVLPEERLIGHLVAPGPGNGLVFDLTGVQVSIDRLAAVLLAVMLPGMASGAAFPIAARALSRARGMGQGVGFAGAAGVGAAMVASLWLGLLPVQGIGTIYSLLAMATLGAVAAVALVPGKLRIAAGAVVAVALLSFQTPPWAGLQIPADEAVVAFVETAAGPSAVAAGPEGSSVYTHGERVAGLALDLDIPLALHPKPSRTLVIAFGTGVNVKGLLQDQGIDELVCVDIDPALPLLAAWIPGVGGEVFDSPRARFENADGRHLLRTRSDRYDLIFSDVATYAQYVELGTVEFLELTRARLAQGGMFALKLHPDTLSAEGLEHFLATFMAVYPDAALFAPRAHMPVLVGFVDGMPKEADVAARLAAQPRLFYAPGLTPPGRRVLLGPTALKKLAGDARPSTDDRPLSLRHAFIGPMHADRTPQAGSPLLAAAIAEASDAPAEVFETAVSADAWSPPRARPLPARDGWW